jgi:hypothetical protein
VSREDITDAVSRAGIALEDLVTFVIEKQKDINI